MLIQYFLIGLFAGALLLTWRRARQGAFSRAGALSWSLIWIAAIILVLRPEASSALARVVGVGRGSDLVIYVAVTALFYAVFRIVLRQEKIEKDISTIVTKMALRDGEKSRQ